MSTARVGFLSLGGICTVCGGVGLLRHAELSRVGLWAHAVVLAVGLVFLVAGWRRK